MTAAEYDKGNAGGEKASMPADVALLALQAWHQIGNGDVEKTGRSDDQDVRDPFERLFEREVTQNATQESCQTGDAIPDQRSHALPSRSQKDREVSGFLGDLVGNDGGCRRPAKQRVGEKGGSDQEAVGEVVKTVADENRNGSFIVQVVMAVRVVFADRRVVVGVVTSVGMSPDSKLLQREKPENSREQKWERFMRRQPRFKCLGQDVQHRGRQQNADGETHGKTKFFFRKAKHDKRGRRNGKQAASKARCDNLNKQRDRFHGNGFKHNNVAFATLLQIVAVCVSIAPCHRLLISSALPA